MIYRKATKEDMEWARNNLRPDYVEDSLEYWGSLDKLWSHYFDRPDIEVTAFIDDEGRCAAVMGVFPVPDDLRPDSAFIILFPTTLLKRNRFGFLRALRKWLNESYQVWTWSSVWSWVRSDRPTDYNLAVKYLGFKREENPPVETSKQPHIHLVYHHRDFLNSLL